MSTEKIILETQLDTFIIFKLFSRFQYFKNILEYIFKMFSRVELVSLTEKALF